MPWREKAAAAISPIFLFFFFSRAAYAFGSSVSRGRFSTEEISL
jgi:hypothetical protein